MGEWAQREPVIKDNGGVKTTLPRVGNSQPRAAC